MGNTIYQRVIDFTANYLDISPDNINGSDSYSGLGIPASGMSVYMQSLEVSFSLIYNPGDENGINIVQDAVVFIKNKIGP